VQTWLRTVMPLAWSLSHGSSPACRSVWISLVILAVSGTLLEGKQLEAVRELSSVDFPAANSMR